MIASAHAKKVYGIEIVPQAIEDAKINAKANHINNIEFINADALKGAMMLLRSKISPDVVIVDPPRKGCSSDTLSAIIKMNPERIVISPGPKSPKEAGICLDVIKKFAPAIPILGICLGHQCIGEAFGATIDHAKKIFHGKQSLVTHTGTSVFTGIDSPVKVARYHSLAIIPETVPDCLSVIAKTDDGEIMAVRHKEYKTVGLQFHPESIYTEHGKRMIENFVNDRI